MRTTRGNLMGRTVLREDPNLDRLLKYIPVEIITLYTAVKLALYQTPEESWTIIEEWAFISLWLIMFPIIIPAMIKLRRMALNDFKPNCDDVYPVLWARHVVVSMIAFCLWSWAIGSPLGRIQGIPVWSIGVATAVWTFGISMFDMTPTKTKAEYRKDKKMVIAVSSVAIISFVTFLIMFLQYALAPIDIFQPYGILYFSIMGLLFTLFVVSIILAIGTKLEHKNKKVFEHTIFQGVRIGQLGASLFFSGVVLSIIGLNAIWTYASLDFFIQMIGSLVVIIILAICLISALFIYFITKQIPTLGVVRGTNNLTLTVEDSKLTDLINAEYKLDKSNLAPINFTQSGNDLTSTIALPNKDRPIVFLEIHVKYKTTSNISSWDRYWKWTEYC